MFVARFHVELLNPTRSNPVESDKIRVSLEFPFRMFRQGILCIPGDVQWLDQHFEIWWYLQLCIGRSISRSSLQSSLQIPGVHREIFRRWLRILHRNRLSHAHWAILMIYTSANRICRTSAKRRRNRVGQQPPVQSATMLCALALWPKLRWAVVLQTYEASWVIKFYGGSSKFNCDSTWLTNTPWLTSLGSYSTKNVKSLLKWYQRKEPKFPSCLGKLWMGI